MKTKLISMLLACIMLVSLAACADNNDKPSSTPEESTKETDVQTTENDTTEEDTTEENTTEPEETGWQGPGKNPDMEDCTHGPEIYFDNENMTLSGLSEYTTVWDVMLAVCWNSYNHYHKIVCYKNGEEVRDSYLEEGMKIKVYHYDEQFNEELYGEYTVTNLTEWDESRGAPPSKKYTVWGDTQTVGVPRNATIEDYTAECIPFAGGYYQFFKDGKEVTSGNLEDGMIVKCIFENEHSSGVDVREIYIADYLVPRR